MSLTDDSAKDDAAKNAAAKNDPAKSDSAKDNAGSNAAATDGSGMDAAADNGTARNSLAKSDAGAPSRHALSAAGTSPVNPFFAAATEDKIEASAVPRPFMSRLLDYSAHAAIAIGLIGFAWTIGNHWMKPSAPPPAAVAAAAPVAQPVDEMTQLRLSNQKMHDEIKALRASVDTLRTTVRRDTTPEQLKMLAAGLEAVKSNVSSASETVGQLNGKIDKLQPSKIQQLTERVTRLEHQGLDSSVTGSIDHKADAEKPSASAVDLSKNVPKPPVKPSSLASTESGAAPAADEKPVLSGWVVRDVYQGVALVEGKRGSLEVVPGVTLPGAGVVKSIERKGTGWVVTTSKGQFASAPTQTAQQREPRRNTYQGPYDDYPRYRYGY